jgi:hypothetical protein
MLDGPCAAAAVFRHAANIVAVSQVVKRLIATRTEKAGHVLYVRTPDYRAPLRAIQRA